MNRFLWFSLLLIIPTLTFAHGEAVLYFFTVLVLGVPYLILSLIFLLVVFLKSMKKESRKTLLVLNLVFTALYLPFICISAFNLFKESLLNGLAMAVYIGFIYTLGQLVVSILMLLKIKKSAL